MSVGANVPVAATVNTNSYALFGSVDYDILRRATLNLGGRYTYEKKDLFYNLDGSASGGLGIGTLFNYRDHFSDNNFSPTIGMTFKLDESNNLYAKYSSGFKSGGWNADFLSPMQLASNIKFNKETVNSYEIGLKGTSPNHRLQYEVAIFLSDYKD